MSNNETNPSTPTSSDDETTPLNENSPPTAARTLPESEANFAFGPQHWYWARYGTRWRFVRSPSSDWSNLGIYEAHWVAFKHDTGFIIGGEDDDGKARLVHTWNDGYMLRADEAEAFVKSRKAYLALHTWLSGKVDTDPEKLKQVSLTIGPKGSYFARHHTSHITHALPADLQIAIQDSDSLPITIALGVKGAWVVLWADGTRSWDLRHAYPSLASQGLLGTDDNNVVFIALNPHVADEFFVVTRDGACMFNASTSDQKEGKKLYKMVEEYMQMRAKRDKSTFSFPMGWNGVDRVVQIDSNGAVKTKGWDLMWRVRRGGVARDILLCGAVAGGAGALARVRGVPVMKAVNLGLMAGGGAAVGMWLRSWVGPLEMMSR